MAAAPAAISPTSSSSWSDLLPDLLGLVLIRLPLPADRARFRAVCRGWHLAARHHARQLPWMVFPDGSFGTIGHGGGFYFPAATILPPENNNVTTCLGAAAVGWLALDCTDDVFRRTPLWQQFSNNRFLQPRRDVKHRHSYRLYNPFTGKTVLLPELDAIIGEVAETFEIRKVLMRHRPSSSSSSSSDSSPDDDELLIAITTNSYYYNIIICRPGKGTACCVLPNIDVFDVVFHGDRLYGITPEEELVALDLAEDDKGAPIVTKCRRVIKRPLADGEQDHRSWMYDDDSGSDDDGDDDNGDDDDGDDDNGSDDDDETSSQNGEEEEEDRHSFNVDDLVPRGEDMAKAEDADGPYDVAITTRRLVVQSSSRGDDGELLMVRHHMESSPGIGTYTLDVEIFKADMEAGNWVPVSELAQGQALFLSRSFSKSIRAYGDIKQGFIYSTDADDVFDTKSRDSSLIRFPIQWDGAADQILLTWLFPPELQL